MRTLLVAALACALFAPAVAAQNGRIDSGVARRLAEIFGDVQVDETKGVGFVDLASEVENALIDVDPDKVAQLNAEISDLEQLERDLVGRLGDLSEGLPVMIGPVESPDAVIGDVSESTLELARFELHAQEAEIARLERLEKMKETKVAAERAARRVTPLSMALLATLEDIPTAEETAVSSVDEPQAEFPLRIARALFVTGDYIGALRQFRQVPAETMTFQGRFEMARCLEEAEKIDEALTTLDALAADSAESDGFWNGRALALKKIIESSRNIRKAMSRSESEVNR